MISGYLARETWLHRVSAGQKLIALAGISLLVVPVEDWRLLALALLAVLGVFTSLGKEALKRLALLRGFLPILAIIFALHFFASGWQAGLSSVLRLVVMVLLADLVSMTTTMQAMMQALMPLLRLLRPFGVNPKKVSLAVSLTIRFVPVFTANWQARAEAWRARTGRRASWRLIGPFLVETLRMADQVAESLDARGFARTNLKG